MSTEAAEIFIDMQQVVRERLATDIDDIQRIINSAQNCLNSGDFAQCSVRLSSIKIVYDDTFSQLMEKLQDD